MPRHLRIIKNMAWPVPINKQHARCLAWIPAFAGMTVTDVVAMLMLMVMMVGVYGQTLRHMIAEQRSKGRIITHQLRVA